MASKLNTRFVLLIIAAAVVGGGAILGGMLLLQWRGDATRNIRQGDAALAQGNLKRARDLYGRAVHKQPGNVEYLKKLEDVVVQLKPQTIEEAALLYRDRVGILLHRTKHRRTEAQAHLDLLREVHAAARTSAAPIWWEYVASAAHDMLENIDESDPQRNYAKVYQSLATLNQSSIKELDELNAATDELESLTREYPNDDLTWSALIMGHRSVIDKMRLTGKTEAMINHHWNQLDRASEEALKAVPHGLDVARANLWRLAARRNADPTSGGVSAQQVRHAADHLVSLLNQDSDGEIFSEAVDLLAALREKDEYDYMIQAIQASQNYLAKHPQAIDKRFSMATWLYLSGRMDEAADHAHLIIASPAVPVSLLAQLQFEVRKRAASLLVDVEQRRWVMETDPANKPSRLASIRAARDQLASLVTNPANDLLLLRADGRIAQNLGDYPTAVACFERVIKESPAPDIEMLLFAADGLIRINQIGLAHERLSTALQYQPHNWGLVAEKARMEVRMGRMEQARQTLATLPPAELEKPEIIALSQAASTTLTDAPAVAADPVSAAIVASLSALSDGEVETARTTLESALQLSPNHPAILQTLVAVEFRDGKIDKAKDYLARAIVIQPDNTTFKQWAAALEYGDPIEALTHYQQSAIADEGERAVVMALSLAAMSNQQEALAKQLASTDPAAADKALAIAARANQGRTAWLKTAREKAPNNPDLVEFEFRRSMNNKDWPAADEIIARARAANLDQVDGNLFKGRMEIVRGNLQEAIHTLESVTDRLSYSSVAWKTLATAYQQTGDWGQAQRAFAQAYKCNPNDIDAAWAYVSVLVHKGDSTRALGVMQTMRKLLPRDPRVREGWLQLEAASGDRELAFNERKRWWLAEPERGENAKAYARLLCETVPNWEIITDDQLKPVVNEQRWSRLAAEDRQKLIDSTRAEWQKKSNEILDRLSANAKDDIQLAVLKARLYRIRNQVMDGEQVLRDFIESHKPNLTAQMLIELGKYQIDSNHFNEGIANLNDAVTYQDPKTRDANLALGQLYLSLNMFDKALPELLKVEETNPNNNLEQNIIECQVRLKNFADARRRLDALLAKQSSSDVTSMLEATILEGQAGELYAKGDTIAAEQKFAEQRELLAKAESQDVTNPTPRILLAQMYFNQYGRTLQESLLDDALNALARADEIKPGDMQTQMMRVDVLKAKGDASGAIAELRRVLVKSPDAPVARRQLLQLYLDSGDDQSAFETIQEAITINPTLGFWWETLGDLYHALRNDPANAQKAYARAYELVPNPKMLGKLLDCSLAVVPPDYPGILDRIEANKAHLEGVASLRMVYARALNGSGRRDEGLEQMKVGYGQYKRDIANKEKKLDPSSINDWYACVRVFYDPGKETAELEAFVMGMNPSPDVHEKRILARMWATSAPAPGATPGAGASPATGATAGLRRAIELQGQAIEQCGNDLKLKSQLLLDLGNYHLTGKQFEEAVVAYEDAVKADPDNVDALNNLAYVYADELHQPQKALSPAERAATLQPRNAAVLDTAGWVNFLVGNNDKARNYLRQSLLEDENSSPTHLHMAHVLLKSGDANAAQEQLKKALELKPDPKTKSQIDGLQEQIKNAK